MKYGQLNGKGYIRWENGDILECDFLNGKPKGIGVMRFNNGNVFEGEF